jgi:fused signal recognition particle receptor
MDVSSVVVESVKNDLVGQKIKRSSDIEEYTYKALKNAVSKIINIEGKSMTELLEEKVAQGEPLVVMLVGINGTGKTTTIGKLCNFYIKKATLLLLRHQTLSGLELSNRSSTMQIIWVSS